MIQRFLYALLQNKWQDFRVIHHAELESRHPTAGRLSRPFPTVLREALLSMGIRSLYSHQAEAIEHIRSGETVVVATPTSSGKSLIYNTTVVEALLTSPQIHALYLFPIKALTRDQLDTLRHFLGVVGGESPFRAEVYDGDTTPHFRNKIRQDPPQILLSNPDMLHYALLPFHTKWEGFWKSLRFVVIDEMHVYRGIFGSHVSQVLRRLLRVCRFYGSSPQFIFLSATIANPRDLAAQLIGVSRDGIQVVDRSGAPQAKRHFIFLDSEQGQAGPASGLAARLIVRAAKAGLKTIAFTQSRKLTELVHMSVLRMAPELGSRVSSYRAGYLPEERRGIEQRLASGSLAAVISTSALEMGIDIGGLDLCVLVGYPGTVMTTWQRGGRVGRSGRESAIILIPQPDALDQYIVRHPEQFLSSRYELAVTNPLNPEILRAHLPCAAAELPIDRCEVEGSGAEVMDMVRRLTDDGQLLQTADGRAWVASSQHPQRSVDIRSVGASYTIFRAAAGSESRVPLGRNDGLRALKECHPGAVYLHRGESFHVDRLDLEKRIIEVTPSHARYFTRVKSEKDTEILEVLASKPVENFIARLGRLRVTEHIMAYEQRRLFSQELLATNPLTLPPQTFETVGFWMELEPVVTRHVQAAGLHYMGGIHAVEHAAISMFPLFALCDRNDIGGISCPQHPQVGKGAIFIYDGYPGGIGLAEKGFELILEILGRTRDLVAACSCEEGCPACIHSPKCGSGNKPLDKQAALAVLEYLLGDRPLNEGLDGKVSQPEPEPVKVHRSPPERPAETVPRMGFFDLETQRLAEEVGGWGNKHLMRMSVAVLFDDGDERFHVYREEEVADLIEHLQRVDLVVGFNIVSFDYEVLRAYSPFNFSGLPTLDILKEIHGRLGFRLSLDHLAEKTLGRRKESDGVQAVKWFREGQWEPLIDYCKKDVILTKDLFNHAMEKGFLMYGDRQGRLLRVPTAWDLKKYLRNNKTMNL
ncbi:MAG: DEAD/DEAH box helicase [Syntrophobacteraceae bacterium]|nr:DEAD/DEAH box helicase [Syntrophobacteraceae bacterium]